MQQRVHQQHRCRHVLCLVRRDLGSVCTDTGESRSWFWSAHFVIRRPHYCCPFHSGPKPVPLKPLYLNFSILLASPGDFTFLASERPLLFRFYFGFILESLTLQSCLCKFFNSVIAFYTTLTCSMILVLCSSPLGAFFGICPFGPLLKAFLLSVSDLRYFVRFAFFSFILSFPTFV